MSAFWLFALSIFFGYLAYDASQFRHSSSHQVWAVPPADGRTAEVDLLLAHEQPLSRPRKYSGAKGFPGLHWVLVVMAVVSAGAGVHLWMLG